MTNPALPQGIVAMHLAGIFLVALPAVASPVAAASLQLDGVDLSAMSSGWGKAMSRQSVTGTPLRIGATAFAHGIGTHANSEALILLDGQASRFTARVGVDDNARDAKASVEFFVYGDGRELWHSGLCRLGEAARSCDVPLQGVRELELVVTDHGDGIQFDHADWADALIEHAGAVPRLSPPPPLAAEESVILTPPAPPEPRINAARMLGVRPGSPFLFRMPCTGERPLAFAADGLPPGLALDAASGILSGTTTARGSHRVVVTATNARGSTRRELAINVGDALALTPPMGWNSWYIHYNRVTELHLRQAADQMISSGMADYGYQYVNVDDCWMQHKGAEPLRDTHGDLLGNEKFPDLKGMVDYIHARGLRAGTYISPGPWTCAGYVGSWQHEAQDARWFARMGFDFLKYDWCSYGTVAGGNDLAHFKRPYQLMWDELRKQDRDIVFNLCQYGMGDVWNWGGEVGHCWRTTGDLGLAGGGGLPGFYQIGMSNAAHSAQARPGAWNDPDYLLIGWVGDAQGMGEGKPTTLTPNEQYSYMSMWCLMASPLIFSGDMAKLDPFTLNVLCNPELIDVDQDPLGKQAQIVRQDHRQFVLAKPLADGSLALGLFNLSPRPLRLDVDLTKLGLPPNCRVRDAWRQSDLPDAHATVAAMVPRHGVAVLRLTPRSSR